MVIPAHLADEVADECIDMTLYEEFVMEKVQGGTPIIGLYPMVSEEAKALFQQWKEGKV